MPWLAAEVACEACGDRWRATVSVEALALDAWPCRSCGADAAHLSGGAAVLLPPEHPDSLRADAEQALLAALRTSR